MHKRGNAAVDRSADYAGEKTLLPLRPVSINLSLFPRLHWSKESRSPQLTFTNSLVTTQPAKKRRMLENDDDGDIEAEIEEIENEIRLLSAKLEALRTKKAKKDLRAANSKKFETAEAVTGCKKKRADLSVNSVTSCCRRQGGGLGQSEKGGKQSTDKRQKPPLAKKPVKREDTVTTGILKPGTHLHERHNPAAGKREDAVTTGILKPGIHLHERQYPAAGKRPEKSDNVEVVTNPCEQPDLEPKKKRRKWSLPPENCRKGFPFYTEPGALAGSSCID